jgi:flagellar biosynthesis/type III secretory pathway protein FliH
MEFKFTDFDAIREFAMFKRSRIEDLNVEDFEMFLEAIWDAAYEAGEIKGYKDARGDGVTGTGENDEEEIWDDGFSEGISEGRIQGREDGYEEGYKKGFKEGKYEGEGEGISKGFSTGRDMYKPKADKWEEFKIALEKT